MQASYIACFVSTIFAVSEVGYSDLSATSFPLLSPHSNQRTGLGRFGGKWECLAFTLFFRSMDMLCFHETFHILLSVSKSCLTNFVKFDFMFPWLGDLLCFQGFGLAVLFLQADMSC